MKNLPGLKLDERTLEYLLDEYKKGTHMKGSATGSYHVWWKRPLAALRVLFGGGMVVYFDNKEG